MRKLAAWALFWLGHALSRIDFEWIPYPVLYWIFFRPYQALMVWSVDVQGDGEGPWLSPELQYALDHETGKLPS